MPARQGPHHHFAGAHLAGKIERLTPEHDELADPANGEKVGRCRTCGRPDQPGNRLLAGTWTLATFSVRYALCESCVIAVAPFDPRSGDPLQAA